MKLSRREIIFNGALMISCFQLNSCFSIANKDTPSKKNLFCFFTRNNLIKNHSQGHIIGGSTSLCILNVDDLSLTQISLPMTSPHSIIQHPVNKNILVITPRDQSLALVVNINNRNIVAKIELNQNQNFYGHGFFSPQGSSLFLTGYGLNSEGFLNEYDLNWKKVSRINTFGKAPHEVKLLEKSDVILVANNGWSGHDVYSKKSLTSMCYIDLKTKRLIEKIELPLGQLAFQHFEINSDGEFVVACDWHGETKNTQEYKSLLGYKKNGSPIEFLSMDLMMKNKMMGNILSVRWNKKTGDIITTTPEGPVTIWSLKTMSARRQVLQKKFPHGLEISSGYIWVTTSNAGVWRASLSSGLTEADFEKIKIPELINITAHAQRIELV